MWPGRVRFHGKGQDMQRRVRRGSDPCSARAPAARAGGPAALGKSSVSPLGRRDRSDGGPVGQRRAVSGRSAVEAMGNERRSALVWGPWGTLVARLLGAHAREAAPALA